MKEFLCACGLAALLSMSVARAYEGDIHYSATYAIARAVGWPEAEALTIASANQAMDENQDTVAALEVDATPGPSFAGYAASSVHQADKNLRFHCFSASHAQAVGISADVRDMISAHFAAIPGRDGDPRRKTRRLIALGVALHCQQDAYAHIGFGGSCGAYPGSCYGHSYETLLDQVFFGALNRHLYNPDHPAVSGRWLLDALRGTAGELTKRRRQDSARAIAPAELITLADQLRESGPDLPDDVRRACNGYIAGKWLFDVMRGARPARSGPDALERLTPGIAITCRNPSLDSATIVRIPDARYPRLNADASPRLVCADGSYERVRVRIEDAIADSRGADAARVVRLFPETDVRRIKVQLSHWSQLLALPSLTRLVAADGGPGSRATSAP